MRDCFIEVFEDLLYIYFKLLFLISKRIYIFYIFYYITAKENLNFLNIILAGLQKRSCSIGFRSKNFVFRWIHATHLIPDGSQAHAFMNLLAGLKYIRVWIWEYKML